MDIYTCELSTIEKRNTQRAKEKEYFKTFVCYNGKHLFRSSPSLSASEQIQLQNVTLFQFLNGIVKDFGLASLVTHIATAVRITSATLRKKSISVIGSDRYPTWDKGQITSTVISDMFVKQITKSGKACVIAPRYGKPINLENGSYVVVLSGALGPSRVTTTNCTSTIFAIYPKLNDRKFEDQVLQKGRNLICAGYAVYGSTTILFIALKDRGAHGFTLQVSKGEFYLSEPHAKIPQRGAVYCLNEGISFFYDNWFLNWLSDWKNSTDEEGPATPVMSRFTKSIVADLHRIIKSGGIYLKPDSPVGDRDDSINYLVHELIPLAFVLDEACGVAVNGSQHLLDIEPTSIDQESCVFMSSAGGIAHLLKACNPEAVKTLETSCNKYRFGGDIANEEI